MTKHITPGSAPLNLNDFRKVGGYSSVHKALKEMSPADITGLVKASNLLGRFEALTNPVISAGDISFRALCTLL